MTDDVLRKFVLKSFKIYIYIFQTFTVVIMAYLLNSLHKLACTNMMRHMDWMCNKDVLVTCMKRETLFFLGNTNSHLKDII